MPKSLKVKVGNKAKSRRSTHNRDLGRHNRQAKTEANRLRKRRKHLKRHPEDLQTAKLL